MVDSKPGAASLAPCLSEGRAGLGLGEVSAQHVLVHDNGGGLVGHCCECVAAARSCCSRICAANTARDAQERARCSVSGVQAGSGVEVQDYVWRAPRWQRTRAAALPRRVDAKEECAPPTTAAGNCVCAAGIFYRKPTSWASLASTLGSPTRRKYHQIEARVQGST